ncbi:MAG TPA: hypothetical protein DCL21_04060 [Alphaproteobacteria bacterium]|nr:hypothetical protein [Alphaproteobacteria bacterium]
MRKLFFPIALSLLALLCNNSVFAAGCLPNFEALNYVDKVKDVELYRGSQCQKFVLGLKNTSYIKQYWCYVRYADKTEKVYLDPNGIDTLLFEISEKREPFSFICKVTEEPLKFVSSDFRKKIQDGKTYVSLRNEYYDRKMTCNFFDSNYRSLKENIVIMPRKWSPWIVNPLATKYECRESIIE